MQYLLSVLHTAARVNVTLVVLCPCREHYGTLLRLKQVRHQMLVTVAIRRGIYTRTTQNRVSKGVRLYRVFCASLRMTPLQHLLFSEAHAVLRNCSNAPRRRHSNPGLTPWG